MKCPNCGAEVNEFVDANGQGVVECARDEFCWSAFKS